jgi:capsular polysaccharide biosynthesis protein
MDLIAFYEVIIARWRIALIAFVATVIATVIFTFVQPSIYEAENTFVLRPRSSVIRENTDVIRVLDTLSNRAEINATIIEVANSDLVQELAISRLELEPREARDLSVNANVLAGTNVVSIAARGSDPEITKEFLDAVSIETASYINNVYDVFQLDLLDEAGVPKSPSIPNKTLNIIIGMILGFILGIGMTMVVEYIYTPSDKFKSINIIDRETGAYNKTYFMLRLKQEIRRSIRNEYVFSLLIIKLFNPTTRGQLFPRIRMETLRKVVATFQSNTRGEDLVSRLEGSMLAILLLDMGEETTNGFTHHILSEINYLNSDQDEENEDPKIDYVFNITKYQDIDIDEEEFLLQALRGLYKDNDDQNSSK